MTERLYTVFVRRYGEYSFGRYTGGLTFEQAQAKADEILKPYANSILVKHGETIVETCITCDPEGAFCKIGNFYFNHLPRSYWSA